MVDGAWSSRSDGNIGGGIGGKLIHKSGATVFIFSGPVPVWNNHEAEVAAIIFLLRAICSKTPNKKKAL